MIKVVAKNFIKEEKINEFITLANTLVEETNKNDKGCLGYGLYQDLKDPKVLTFIEEWESAKDLENHSRAKHFIDILPKLREFIEKPGETNMYEQVK